MSFEIPQIGWLEAEANPWGIRLLDVSPVTFHMISTSSDPQCAANSISYSGDSGAGFIFDEPPIPRTVTTSLTYRIDDELWAGALFRPSVMEHKWAIFYHFERIFFVRSWQRKVFVIADTKKLGEFLEVRAIRGTFLAEAEPPDFSCRVLDYLIRSHVLGLDYPAPLLPGIEADPQQAALWCFSAFGCMARVAAVEDPCQAPPLERLRILD